MLRTEDRLVRMIELLGLSSALDAFAGASFGWPAWTHPPGADDCRLWRRLLRKVADAGVSAEAFVSRLGGSRPRGVSGRGRSGHRRGGAVPPELEQVVGGVGEAPFGAGSGPAAA
jgi:hypothetical protein